MSRKIKGLMQGELIARFEGVTECAVVSIRGVDGVSNNRLRGELSEKGISLTVVKNSLAARAFADMGMEGIKDILEGPCSIVFGGDNIVDLAKLMAKYDKEIKAFEIKGGYLEGSVLNAEQTRELAKMPNRAELQGAIVMIAKTPGSNVAGAIGGPASYIAGCIKTIADKEE